MQNRIIETSCSSKWIKEWQLPSFTIKEVTQIENTPAYKGTSHRDVLPQPVNVEAQRCLKALLLPKP
jgi:hypothetical protein